MIDKPGTGSVQEDAVQLAGVSKWFRTAEGSELHALDNVDLHIAEGEFVSLVGASGSGKTTLLRIIAGLLFPDEGTASAGGRVIRGPGTDRAFVFQHDCLLPWQSTFGNASFGLRMHGRLDRAAKDRVQELLELVGLLGFEDYYPHQLSGGMRQRVNLARALAVQPEILLMDEPFAALDAQTREVMQAELLRIWAADRHTVVFVTHQIDEAVYLADRVVILGARPGSIRDEIEIEMPRPRSLDDKHSDQFVHYTNRVWHLIKEDVLRGARMEMGGSL